VYLVDLLFISHLRLFCFCCLFVVAAVLANENVYKPEVWLLADGTVYFIYFWFQFFVFHEMSCFRFALCCCWSDTMLSLALFFCVQPVWDASGNLVMRL